MAVQDRLYTTDELWELSQRPEYAEQSVELWEGVIVTLAPSSIIPSIIASRLDRLIGNYVDEHQLGYTSTAEGGYELGPNDVLAPDVGFIAKERVTEFPKRYYIGAPDLAVEVKSPTDKKRDMRRKAEKYLSAGTRLVWLVFPDERQIEVYFPGEDVRTAGAEDTVDGGDVLPGLAIPVREIFAQLKD